MIAWFKGEPLSKVDMSFVMSMQVARLLIILSIGPAISRWIARRVTGEEK
jgi:uncharacterized membrane protein AbrB (regulator of aidB expression)